MDDFSDLVKAGSLGVGVLRITDSTQGYSPKFSSVRIPVLPEAGIWS